MKNFCANYLGMLKENKVFDKITDGFVDIETIKIFSPMKFRYYKPKLIYDKFSKSIILAEPSIERISYNDVKGMGFVIISKVPHKKWFVKQRTSYILIKESLIKGQEVVMNLPEEHRLEFDKNNKLLRLKGRCAGAHGAGDWLEIKSGD